MKEQPHICPLCGRAYDEPPALSRVDNQTDICPRCGMMEALAAMPRRETPQERTRRAVYATGNHWAIENFEATHHYQATLGQQETIELTREKWLSLTNGQHQLRIEAVDGNFATSVRVFSFSKKETVIKFELVAPEETDAAATKVLVTPTWKIEGAVAKVEACNNGFDAVPTWEDITAMVQINRVYNFANKTKTASKWGVNIRFTITKNEGFEGEVSISGFGGAYE